jgi:SAM-dependent methyltransferase
METSEYANIARLEDAHWWYAGMRHIAASLVRGLLLPPNAAILDAGCGVGGGLKWLAEFGTPTGIDLHPLAVAYARQASGRVAQASIQAPPFPANTFDLVTTFEVLYHLSVRDDIGAVRQLARVLRPGGWLLLRVPAHDWLRGAHDRQVHTRKRYTADEVRRLLAGAGLTVRRLTPLGAFLFPAAVLRRLTDRPSAAHSDVTLPPPALNRLLTSTLKAEALWLRRWPLPFGLSVLALAQKAGQ